MTMLWTLTATCLLGVSTVATFFTMVHLRFRWDVHTSSVRWLFWFFFLSIFAWCLLRSVFFVWMSSRPVIQLVDEEEARRLSYSQLDRLGIHGILYMREAKKVWLTVVICAGDLALFGIALTLFPLTYELWRLARKSMDRGIERERAMIRVYWLFITSGLVLYAVAQLVLTAVFGGYNIYTHRCLMGVYVLQFLSLIIMVAELIGLKLNGRNYETIHGSFVASPVYRRLKTIMLVYALFAFQFQLSMFIVVVHLVTPDSAALSFIGISLMIYNASGLALSITTSCSQACILSTFGRCLPEDFEAQFLHQRFPTPTDQDLQPPSLNPVFVFTDIQSSTALWNRDGEMMAVASDIHDSIMRSSMLKHRGYEITTVGDAFHIAFHTISDALEFCLDVQLQLLVASWPKQVHGAVPATMKQRSGRRVIFNGLRVRMGIHDANESDGPLVRNVHVVTGKATYTGVSEVVAESVSELGSGGQVLLTDRVATWLMHHRDDLSIDVFMDYVGEYIVPQVNTRVGIYQLQPAILAARTSFFGTTELQHTMPSEESDSPLVTRAASTFSESSLDVTTSCAEESVENLDEAASPQFKLLHSPRSVTPRCQWLQKYQESALTV